MGTPSLQQPPVSEPQARTYSRGGLIAAAIMTAWCLAGLIFGQEGSGQPAFACFCANAALAWRSFRPPLGLGQGLATWFGGMIAGLAVSAFEPGSLLVRLGLFVTFIAIGGAFIWAGTPGARKSKWLLAVVVFLVVAFILIAISSFFVARRRRQPLRTHSENSVLSAAVIKTPSHVTSG